MKRWSIPFGFLLIALGAAFYYQQLQANTRASSTPAPDFTLKDLTGQAHHLADFRGKVVFLNVWATWCAPCRMEMPSMENLYRRLHGKDFVMLAVNEDEEGRAVQPFVNEMGLTFPVLIDPNGVVPPRYGVTGYPETFIIDRGGKIIQHTIGPEDWDSQEALQYFTQLLDQGQGTTQAAGDHAQPGS
jgi:peroxiredoxin